MSRLIDRAELFNRLSAVKTLGEAFAVIQGMPSAQPEWDCILKQFGECTYKETGCSDCRMKAKIKAALSSEKSAQPDGPDTAEVITEVNRNDNMRISRNWKINDGKALQLG